MENTETLSCIKTMLFISGGKKEVPTFCKNIFSLVLSHFFLNIWVLGRLNQKQPVSEEKGFLFQ